MIEIWKDVKGYEGLYQVSNLGNVKSLTRKTKNQYGKKNILLKQINDKNGYKIVSFGGKLRKVHRLVAIAFIPNPENKPQVNHKDCDKTNNKVSNLEWVTSKENIVHAYKNGVFDNVEREGKHIIAKKDDKVIKFKSEIELARYLGVVPSAINNCLKGRSKTCKGYKIEYDKEEQITFIPKGHIYLLNDLIVIPSVTEILNKMFPDKYSGIPKKILERKSKYGTELHKYIEEYEKGIIKTKLNYIQEASFKQYLRLKDKHNIEVLEQEQIVHYKDIYAGTFDMIANVNGKKYLIDIKTTSILDKQYLSWQLSLYEYAYGEKFDGLACIWLPKKELGEFVEIERKSKEEIDETIEEFIKEIF